MARTRHQERRTRNEGHPQIPQIYTDSLLLSRTQDPEFYPQISQIPQMARTRNPKDYPQITQIPQISGQELHPQTRKTTAQKGVFIHRFHRLHRLCVV